MDEIIVRVARAIASSPRLRLLSCLVRHGEMNPDALAEELQMPASAVSAHLRILVTGGLAQRRKSGAWCYYRADSPYGEATLSGKLAAWLTSVLGSPERRVKHLGPGKVRDDLSDPDARLHATIFEAATAFTDLRRLQILRHLAQEGTVTAQELSADLSMSTQAVSRHTTKLRRRGYVRMLTHTGRQATYQLSRTSTTAIHAKMFVIVRSVWETA